MMFMTGECPTQLGHSRAHFRRPQKVEPSLNRCSNRSTTQACVSSPKMMEAYKGDTFSGDGKTLFIYFFGMMGTMIGHAAIVNATMGLPTAKRQLAAYAAWATPWPGRSSSSSTASSSSTSASPA